MLKICCLGNRGVLTMLGKNPKVSHQYDCGCLITSSRRAQYCYTITKLLPIYSHYRHLEIKVKVKEESACKRIKPKKLELGKLI